MNKLSTYLAGPINGKNIDEARIWRKKITHELADINIRGLDPFGNGGGDRISPELRQKLHNANVLGDIDTIRDIVGNTIIPPDLDMIMACDFLTVYIPKDDGYEICGTYGEVTLAHYLKKPVFIVTERKMFPCELPSWLIGCSTNIFTSWKDYLLHIFNAYHSLKVFK
jgi:hypothetical protein